MSGWRLPGWKKYPNSIQDADGDTKIQVEESPDEDIIRFDIGGTEKFIVNSSGPASSAIQLNDTNSTHQLSLIWNENDTADRTLNLLVGAGSRNLSLSGDLTVESASLINQDLTTDATPTFVGASMGDGNITNVGDIALDSVSSDVGNTTPITVNAPLAFGSLGTSTKAIDLSSSGLSGGSDYWIYNDTSNYWAADGSIGMGPKIQITGAVASNYNRLIFATASGTACQINSDEGKAQMMWTVGSLAGYQINIIDQSFHDEIDYDHAAQTNPTVFLHAAINPNVSNNYWGSISHDQGGFVISTGDETGAGTTPATIDNYIGFNTAANGLVKHRCWNKSVDDDATITLNAAGSGMTNGGFGVIFVGNNEERSFFFVDDDGDVTLINNSANVVANADTDAKVCLGTAATQEPLTVKNRLGATKVFNILLWYN